MAWCRQATNHYMSKCWPSSVLPNGITRPQWVKSNVWLDLPFQYKQNEKKNEYKHKGAQHPAYYSFWKEKKRHLTCLYIWSNIDCCNPHGKKNNKSQVISDCVILNSVLLESDHPMNIYISILWLTSYKIVHLYVYVSFNFFIKHYFCMRII